MSCSGLCLGEPVELQSQTLYANEFNHAAAIVIQAIHLSRDIITGVMYAVGLFCLPPTLPNITAVSGDCALLLLKAIKQGAGTCLVFKSNMVGH